MSPVIASPDTEKGSDSEDHSNKAEGGHEYPSGKVVIVIMVALCLAVFLIALVCSPCEPSAFLFFFFKERSLTSIGLIRIELLSPLLSLA